MPNDIHDTVKKLNIRTGMRVAFVNAPDGYAATLVPLPEESSLLSYTRESFLEGAHPQGAFDAVLAFCFHKADADALTLPVLTVVKMGGLLWMAYPKAGKLKTDINCDKGWDAIGAAEWSGVTQIALDDTWSALRFRPTADIPVMTRKIPTQE